MSLLAASFKGLYLFHSLMACCFTLLILLRLNLNRNEINGLLIVYLSCVFPFKDSQVSPYLCQLRVNAFLNNLKIVSNQFLFGDNLLVELLDLHVDMVLEVVDLAFPSTT